MSMADASLAVGCDRMVRALARDESADDTCVDHTTPQSLGLTDSASSLPGCLSLNDTRYGLRSNGTSNHSNSSGAIGESVTKTLSENVCRPVKETKVKKSDVCRHWARGFCNRGLSCGFGHTGPSPEAHQQLDENGKPVVEELDEQAAHMKKYVPCKDHNSGKCNRGDRCKFAHIGTGPKKGTPACRDHAAGICKRSVCKYKHEDPQGRLISAPGEPITPAMQGAAAVCQFVDPQLQPQQQQQQLLPEQQQQQPQQQVLPAVPWGNTQFTLRQLVPQLSSQSVQQPPQALQPAPALQPQAQTPLPQQQQPVQLQPHTLPQQQPPLQQQQLPLHQQVAIQPPQLPQRGVAVDAAVPGTTAAAAPTAAAQQIVVCRPAQPVLAQLSQPFPILVGPSPTTDGAQNLLWQVPAAQPIAVQMSPDGNMLGTNAVAGFHDGSNAVMQHQPYA